MARHVTLRLRPARSEGRTSLLLRGTLPDQLPTSALHQLLSLLAYWSGQQVHVVLFADDPVGWVEVWCDALAGVPERHLRVRFRHGTEDGFCE